MIISILSEKGGTGKSTIATNITVMRAKEGKDVLLVDADPQKSSRQFADIRSSVSKEPSFTCAEIVGQNIGSELEKLSSKFDDIIVDVAGMYSSTMRGVLRVSNVAVVPFHPTQMDMWGVQRMDDILDLDANKDLIVIPVLNMVHTNPRVTDSKDVEVEFENLKHLKSPCIPLGHRVSFCRSIAEGISVTEMQKPDVKAIDEIMKLYREIFKNG